MTTARVLRTLFRAWVDPGERGRFKKGLSPAPYWVLDRADKKATPKPGAQPKPDAKIGPTLVSHAGGST